MGKAKKRQIQIELDRKGLKQSQLAEILGLTPALISLICLGRSEPKVAVAIKIARAIGEPVEKLFSDVVDDGRHGRSS